MAWRHWLAAGLLGVCGLAPAARADDPSAFPFPPRPPTEKAALPRVPPESLAPAVPARVQSVLERPALSAKGRPEKFHAEGEVYRWLLDHPGHTVKLWRQVGAKVSDIQDRGDGVYSWRDENNGELSWQTALKLPGLH